VWDVDIPRAGGTIIGERYQIVRVIARVGTGVVYEAEHTWTGRRVAIKTWFSRLPGSDGQMARFRQEVRSLARLDHPHLVPILDMGCDAEDGAFFVVRELLVGEDLEQRLSRSPQMSPEDLLAVVRPILDALRLSHRHGVLHRDIEPSNIFLAESGDHGRVPKLIDFGTVELLHEGADGLARASRGSAVRTRMYTSPEQRRGEALDARADVWSLGMVMYRALAGRLPFDARVDDGGSPGTPGSAPAPIERPDVPRWLIAVVERALSVAAARRFPSAEAMLDALQAPPAAAVRRTLVSGEADDSTLIDDGKIHDLLQRARRTLPLPPIADELTNVPAENERMQETIDERPRSRARAEQLRGVVQVAPTPAPPAPLRAPVPVHPRSRPGRSPWKGKVRMGLVAPPRGAGADAIRRLEETIEGTWSLCRFPSYSTLVDALSEEEVDLAWLPPVAYLRARKLGPVHLLLALERTGPTAYGSAIVAAERAGVATLPEIRGKRVAWVDVWSAAGYLMPRSVIREAGFDPEQVFASQTFVGSHAAVLDALQEGRADVGATYCSLGPRGSLVAAPWSDRPALHPVAVSRTIPGDAICAAGELPIEHAEAMVEPLIALSADKAGTATLQRVFGADRFFEVDPSYYAVLDGA
jgi:serine/threonine-protein kinase